MSASPNKVFRVDIRKLPPNLTQNELQLAIKDYADNIVYQYFVPGQFKYHLSISYCQSANGYNSQGQRDDLLESSSQLFFAGERT